MSQKLSLIQSTRSVQWALTADTSRSMIHAPIGGLGMFGLRRKLKETRAALSTAMAERDVYVQQRDIALGERNEFVRQRDVLISERDEYLRQRDLAIQDRDEIERNLLLRTSPETLSADFEKLRAEVQEFMSAHTPKVGPSLSLGRLMGLVLI
jgi:uncharacterized protein (DUF3084 family)